MDLHLFRFFPSLSMSVSYTTDLLKLFQYLLCFLHVAVEWNFYLPGFCLLPSSMSSLLRQFCLNSSIFLK